MSIQEVMMTEEMIDIMTIVPIAIPLTQTAVRYHPG
jgi:hypothetical protein